jgi:hypothetical protein
MDRTYTTADHTVIYLGPVGPEVGFLQEKLTSDKTTQCSLSTKASSTELVEFFFSKPWFSRVWVFQELIFSQNPHVQCSKY